MTDVSTEALAFLDQHCAPMTARQIERTLREYGISKSQRSVRRLLPTSRRPAS